MCQQDGRPWSSNSHDSQRNTDTNNRSWMTVPLLESKTIAEVSAPGQSIKFKSSALTCQKSHFPLPMPTLPQSGTVQGQERPPWPMVFPAREIESEVSIQLTQACKALPKMPTSISSHPEYRGDGLSWLIWEKLEAEKRGGGSEQPACISQQPPTDATN